MAKEWGFAITSIGMIADFHARAIQAMTGGRLVACYSRRKEAVDEFAKKYNCKPYYNYKKLLRDKEVEIVTICAPSGSHLDYALPAIKAKKHIIVEKPLEITLKRCDKMIAAAEKAGVAARRGLPEQVRRGISARQARDRRRAASGASRLRTRTSSGGARSSTTTAAAGAARGTRTAAARS